MHIFFVSPLIFANTNYSVSRAFENLVQEFAASPDPVIRSAGFEYVSSDVHVPILNLSIPDRYYPGKLSNVVIQGTFATNMRDFNRIFQDLTQELHGQSFFNKPIDIC